MKFPFPLSRTLALPALLGLLLISPAASIHATAAPEKKASSSDSFDWENAVIHIEVTSKEYSYVQPWARSERKTYKSGVVVEGHQIITTAEGLNDQTLIRLKKNGTGLFSLGTIAWIDYQANLAAITTTEKDFWAGLEPARLADPTPISGPVRIVRWEDDQFGSRQGEIDRFIVDDSVLSFVSVPILRIDSTILGASNGEAVVANGKLVGLACQQDGEAISAIPSSFIESILKAREKKDYTGLGYFDFTWEPIQDPLVASYLKLPGPVRGVIVKETGLKPGTVSPVKPRDIVLQIDGFDIDAQGNYRDPDYKKLSLENLSSRNKWAGMESKLKIWRDGKELNVTYKLPKAEYSDELLPNQTYDQDPQYVLAGGFIFVPLTTDYLRSWGANWRQRAPFRVFYYSMDKVKPDRPQRVILSQVLPDETNIGYEGLRNAVVDEINGIKIKTIADVATALKSPINGFDVFNFEIGGTVRQAVLDASEVDGANQNIMARYHIPTDHVLASSTPKASDGPVLPPTPTPPVNASLQLAPPPDKLSPTTSPAPSTLKIP